MEIKATFKSVLTLFALLLSASAQPQTITGKVVSVNDGDTIKVLDTNNQQRTIRLDGIDAPESAQDFGSRAKESLSDLIFGKTVTVTSWKTDRYGRTFGKVTLDGKNINLEQVNRGLAWFYRYYAKDLQPEDAAAYERAENESKAGKRGLWADPTPTPPWDFRRRRTSNAPSAPPPTTTGGIIGNRSSRVYHLSVCPGYLRVAERNRVTFKTEAEARAAGYRKAVDCLW